MRFVGNCKFNYVATQMTTHDTAWIRQVKENVTLVWPDTLAVGKRRGYSGGVSIPHASRTLTSFLCPFDLCYLARCAAANPATTVLLYDRSAVIHCDRTNVMAVWVDPAEGQIVAGVGYLVANSERESAFRDLRFLISNGNGEAAARYADQLVPM
jgi:hypothetical protein